MHRKNRRVFRDILKDFRIYKTTARNFQRSTILKYDVCPLTDPLVY